MSNKYSITDDIKLERIRYLKNMHFYLWGHRITTFNIRLWMPKVLSQD